MSRKFIIMSVFISALLISACGVVVTPAWEAAPTEAAVVPTQAEIILLGDGTARPTEPPTATPEPPTATPVPPTATLVPTEVPTEEVVEVTEEAPAAAVAVNDPLAVLVSSYDPADGEELFNRVEPSNGYSCAMCHSAVSEAQLIGPGLLNISTRGATRVEGEGAATYIYNSIVDPGAFVVPGFPDNLMPRNWHQVYNDDQIYSIVAYVLTLNG